MRSIINLDITDEEFGQLFSGAFKDREHYLAEIKEPYTTADAIDLCIIRGQFKKAECLYEKLADEDKIRFYPEGLEIIKTTSAK